MTEAFIIGIIWATGSISGKCLLVRNKNYEIIEPVASFFKKKIYRLGNRNLIKIRLSHPIARRLHDLAWTGRKDVDRRIPSGDIDLMEWAKGYCSVRAHIDKKGARLRIYGSQSIVEALSNDILKNIGLAPKKPQHSISSEGETWGISYQTAEQVSIFSEWMIGGA